MSEKLFESGIITTNLGSLFRNVDSDLEAEESNTNNNFTEPVPTQYDGNWWKAELARRLAANKTKDARKQQTPTEVEETFFKDFFQTNWPEEIANKLIAIGDPLKKAIKVLGFNYKKVTGGNPILAFIRQNYVQKYLIQTGLLNANTFKAIYNTVARHLTSDVEFYKANNYNLIYCRALYSKTPTEMLEYLELQKEILNPNEPTDIYRQLENRRVFLEIPGIREINVKQRAIIIKGDRYKDASKVPTVTNAKKLNSLVLAKTIKGSTEETIHRTTNELTEIVAKLSTLADKFAAILSLSISTKSKTAKAALSVEDFAGLDGAQITKAFTRLSAGGIMPRGQLNETDADTLVKLILASMKAKQQEDTPRK